MKYVIGELLNKNGAVSGTIE